MMEKNFSLVNFQELSVDDLMTIDGGAPSAKTIAIGVGLTLLSPIIGAGYWFGYYVNS